MEDVYAVVEGSLSRETDLAEVRIYLAPMFTRSQPLRFSSLDLCVKDVKEFKYER